MYWKRFPHIIAGKKTTTIPSNVVFFDTETQVRGTKLYQGTGKHVLAFGWMYAYRTEGGKRTREVWTRFETGKQFFSALEKRLCLNKPLYVYAHNLGFDLTIVGFFKHWKELGFDITFHTFDSPPTIFKCQWKGHSITFVDTLNYWTTSLKDLGNSVGLPKLDMPKDKVTPEVWNTYARRDVEIIDKAVDGLFNFVVKHNCGGVGLTLASLSMYAYRHKHMKYDIYIHDRLKVLALERSGYYGGLVQAYQLGKIKGPVYNLDINSHYPSMMLKRFPCKLIDCWEDVPLPRLIQCVKSHAVIANVRINSRSQTFPFRDKKRRLTYVRGRFETTLCGPELERAIKHKCITKVNMMAVYEHAPLFTDFVNYFWNLRRDYIKVGDKVNSFFCKILLNSLYGKFGQRGVSWVSLTEETLDLARKQFNFDPEKTKYSEKNLPYVAEGYSSWTPDGIQDRIGIRNMFSGMEVQLKIKEHADSFPAIAAYVTAYGREHLLKYVDIAGIDNTFYCDTDSLFVNRKGYLALKNNHCINNKELGFLKLEGEAPSMHIYGLKDYTFADKLARKGVKPKAIKLAENKFWEIRFEGLRGILRRGGDSYVKIDSVIKNLRRMYEKGQLTKSGRVVPFNRADF